MFTGTVQQHYLHHEPIASSESSCGDDDTGVDADADVDVGQSSGGCRVKLISGSSTDMGCVVLQGQCHQYLQQQPCSSSTSSRGIEASLFIGQHQGGDNQLSYHLAQQKQQHQQRPDLLYHHQHCHHHRLVLNQRTSLALDLDCHHHQQPPQQQQQQQQQEQEQQQQEQKNDQRFGGFHHDYLQGESSGCNVDRKVKHGSGVGGALPSASPVGSEEGLLILPVLPTTHNTPFLAILPADARAERSASEAGIIHPLEPGVERARGKAGIHENESINHQAKTTAAAAIVPVILVDDVWRIIFYMLAQDCKDLGRCMQVNRRFHSLIANDAQLWKLTYDLTVSGSIFASQKPLLSSSLLLSSSSSAASSSSPSSRIRDKWNHHPSDTGMVHGEGGLSSHQDDLELPFVSHPPHPVSPPRSVDMDLDTDMTGTHGHDDGSHTTGDLVEEVSTGTSSSSSFFSPSPSSSSPSSSAVGSRRGSLTLAPPDLQLPSLSMVLPHHRRIAQSVTSRNRNGLGSHHHHHHHNQQQQQHQQQPFSHNGSNGDTNGSSDNTNHTITNANTNNTDMATTTTSTTTTTATTTPITITTTTNHTNNDNHMVHPIVDRSIDPESLPFFINGTSLDDRRHELTGWTRTPTSTPASSYDLSFRPHLPPTVSQVTSKSTIPLCMTYHHYQEQHVYTTRTMQHHFLPPAVYWKHQVVEWLEQEKLRCLRLGLFWRFNVESSRMHGRKTRR
ncbi:hypothetical protein B0O80DRAFT_464412 [Mortierella sp. GBAus27b]|nr:hypothetical protein B0O80DRAFT_464412 [Mortierella sp. GBAus27b]